jgi:DNA repair protein RadA/Sms
VARKQTQFICSRCGRAQAQWLGRCPECGEWNSLVEQRLPVVTPDRHRSAVVAAESPLLSPLAEIAPDAHRRYDSGIGEFDRVLGGGIVPGSAILVGGDPGIGKSTLLLQVSHALAGAGRKTLYLSSEESPGQIRLRADRLGLAREPTSLKVCCTANLDVICHLLDRERPEVVVVDSIQMVYRPDGASAPGTAAQLRDSAAQLIWLAKQLGFALLLVGHVTKEGAIAGPRILEHLVDCVAYFEGDRFHSHRIIRTVKNRFGSTDELGLFEIGDAGLRPIADPSQVFLQSKRQARPGSVILAACEGTRTLLVEVQALCAQSVFGAAKRKATGVEAGRVAMILAVIEKHAECVVGDQDVFVNVVGGVRVNEPAADLAIGLAVISVMTGRALGPSTVVCGELGLGGELRPVHHQRQRIAEAARVGFAHFLCPGEGDGKRPTERGAPIDVVACEHISDARRHLS